jgi:hypothetical protein
MGVEAHALNENPMHSFVIDPELRLVDGTIIRTIGDAHAYMALRADLGPDWARTYDRLAGVRSQQGAVHAANDLKALLTEENLLDTAAERA